MSFGQGIDSVAGRVALVTGGGSGIGLATVRALAAAGAETVVVVDLDEKAARVAAEEVDGEAVWADVTDPEQWQRIASDFRPQLVHLNAGIAIGPRDPATLTDAEYRRLLGVNID